MLTLIMSYRYTPMDEVSFSEATLHSMFISLYCLFQACCDSLNGIVPVYPLILEESMYVSLPLWFTFSAA